MNLQLGSEILPTGHPTHVGVAPGCAMSCDRRDWFQQLFGFKEAGLGLLGLGGQLNICRCWNLSSTDLGKNESGWWKRPTPATSLEWSSGWWWMVAMNLAFSLKMWLKQHDYVTITYHNWLVVWNMNFIFPLILGCFHHPNWRTLIFFRGVAQPPTRYGSTRWYIL